MSETETKNSKVSLKLLIDRNAKKVLFAEAGKDTVDFLFNLLALPVGTVIRLLTKQKMVGCIGNLYESVENLGADYIQTNKIKDTLLKPKASICTTNSPLLMLETSATNTKVYTCNANTNYTHHHYYSDSYNAANCPSCNNKLGIGMDYVRPATTVGAANVAGEVGFVKGVVTYMVMDNLVVKPMSTISSITLLNQFNVKDVGALEEKTVHLDMPKALKLLKESLNSNAVLTAVFLDKTK